MGKFDKDRLQKELAVRYCLAKGLVPFLEVVVRSAADLSDSVEVLTDIDVLGVESVGDGGLQRTIFDCKTASKLSSINRAFWAAGVREYTGSNEAFVVLKSKAVHNHRLSALTINVDLHDEQSFRDLGLTVDPAFPADNCYQASIERWNAAADCFIKNSWSEGLFDLARNIAPITKTPWSTFRRVLSELRAVRGEFDPAKDTHISIFFDLLASCLVLWALMGRDIRRFYEPTMNKENFGKILKYYMWGGKESYNIRQLLQDKAKGEGPKPMDLPAWDLLQAFAGLLVSSPRSILECAHVCRELSMRTVTKPSEEFDRNLASRMKLNNRVRQFSVGLSDYLVAAGNLPRDFGKRVEEMLFKF